MSPFEGSLELGDDIRLPDIWQALHANADSWERASMARDGLRQQVAIDEGDRAILGTLSGCNVDRWMSFAGAAGWTRYSAIATSWCDMASLQHVAEAWSLAPPVNVDHPVDLRPARLIKPSLLPETRSIARLLELHEASTSILTLLVLADPRPPVLDLDETVLSTAVPQLAGALLARAGDMGKAASPFLTEAWTRSAGCVEAAC